MQSADNPLTIWIISREIMSEIPRKLETAFISWLLFEKYNTEIMF